MSVLKMFTWLEGLPAGEAIRASLWLFPVIESFHLLALALMGGAVLMLNIKLFGFGLRSISVEQLWRDTRPFLVGSLIVLLISGALLFLSEATKLYYNGAFWFKMGSLLLAISFTFTVERKVVHSLSVAPVWSKVVAVVSMALWTGVGVGGRWIGFS